jgi:23S rRNA pseudouridine1911/1915/1917 synthase
MEKVKIVFENDNFLVVEKPAGLVVANENGREKETVEAWLLKNRGGKELKRQGIVHRLDKGTSGLLLVAKTEEYWKYLTALFKNRQIIKRYLALVSGEVSLEGRVEMPIGRSQRHFGRFEVRENGKKSETRFERVAVINFSGRKYSLIGIDLKTGRTHQIRVHFRYLGWPLVGDRLYGGDVSLGIERPFLHAAEIKFRDSEGNLMHFESKIPADLRKLLEKIGYEEKKE